MATRFGRGGHPQAIQFLRKCSTVAVALECID